MFVVTGSVKRRVVNSVMDLITFEVVVGQVGASQRKASLGTDSPLKRLPCEESSSTHWNGQMGAADGTTKKNAVEMNQEGLLEKSPGKISQQGL